MGNAYNNASLLVTPNGYKASKIYSAKPTDGTGDLAFSRASNATRVNSAGLIEKVRTNIFPTGSALTTAIWDNVGATLTAGQTDPNGGTGAMRVQLAGGSVNYIAQVFTNSSVSFTRSVFIKAATAQTIRLVEPNTGGNVLINVTTSYQRFSLSVNGTSSAFGIRFDNENDSAAKDFTIAFIQLETGDVATDYIPTTTAAVSVGITADIPRLDYTGGGCPSLLLEPQRTNLVTFSEQLDNAAWVKQSTLVTANATISPDGYTNADKLIGTAANSFHAIYNFANTLTGIHTVSFYAKKGEYDFIVAHDQFSSRFLSVFNLNTGTVVSGSGTSMQSVGNGWYRCVVTFDGAGVSVIFSLSPSPTSASGTNYLGDGTSGVFVWGSQLEAGAYATSYIPTLGSSVTRLADAASKTGISSLIGQTAGTLYADVNWTFKNEAGSPVVGILTINNNVANFDNCIILGIERQTSGINRVYCLVQNAGATEAVLFGSSISSGRYKIALAYTANDFVLYVNGVQIATDTSGSVPTTSQVLLGSRFNGDSVITDDTINAAALYTTRLSNSELAELTTL